MTYSRRALYALGEPLGQGATRVKPCGGGMIYGEGGDSSSSSSSNTTTNTINTDARMVVDGGGVGINSGGGAVGQVAVTTINNTVDAGAVAAGRDVAMTALNDNAFNTAAIIGAAQHLTDQTVNALQLNTDLAGSIAAAGAASNSESARLNATSFKDLLGATTGLFVKELDLTKSLADGARGAYSDATMQATGNKQLLMGVMAVVAVVAAIALSRH